MTSSPETLPARTGLMLVTHQGIATALIEQARKMLGEHLEDIQACEIVNPGPKAREALLRARQKADLGQGVLVLTDLPGATPANLALALRNGRCRVVSGLSLPMLIRAWNYRARPLGQLTELALEGARSAAVELH